METIEIYWNDLSKEKRAEILRKMEYNSNWDLFPMFVIEVEAFRQDKEEFDD